MIPELLAEELHSLVLGTWLMMIPELSAEELHCLVLGTLAHDDSWIVGRRIGFSCACDLVHDDSWIVGRRIAFYCCGDFSAISIHRNLFVLGVGTISELLNGRISTQVLLLNLSPRATKSVLIPELKRMSACSLGGYLQKTRQRLLRRGGQEEVKDSGKFYLFCWETTKGHHCQWFSEVRRIV
jgi:hypothetical protein